MTKKNEDGWPEESAEEILDKEIKKAESRHITPEMHDALRAEFPGEAYKKHDSKSYLTTLKAMYVVERLNAVFGLGRWTVIHKVESAENNYVLMSGYIKVFDYDVHVPIQYGGHATSGTGKEPADGYKSAITDILSKSASYLEIGIELFKGNINPGGGKPSQPKEPIKPIEDINKFMEVWEGGKIYGGKHVFYKSRKFEASPDQIGIIKKHPKYKGD